jgi:cytochrome o ubiquinol oxidase subunit 2
MSASAWSSGVLDPQGPVAAAERTILLNATIIMLAVVVPVIVCTGLFAWWFRSGNRRAERRPDWSYSGALEVLVWSVPLLVIVFLGGIAWLSSHELDPRRPLAGDMPTVEVQVVSLDWQWLFIYPDLGIASINRLVVPAGSSMRLQLTSASVMNSFFVPQLGSQIYTMAGMVTTLHLRADRPGRYPGLSAQFSGEGFSDMRFEVSALPQAEYEAWVANARTSDDALDAPRYRQLARPTSGAAPSSFGRIDPGLFDAIVAGNGTLKVAEAAASAAPR